MSEYIKDLIEIPDHVGRGDFVLRLSEGVTDPEGTIKHYQVTPQLVSCFDDALKLVRGSLPSADRRASSKAAYLHGSFGSGKSHFMAILSLILAGDTHARSIPELADVIAKHTWTNGKRFLLVPYHLIGARNLESAVLGGYTDFISRSHPEAPTPPVYRAEQLLANAESLRRTMGDAKFFEGLNQGKGGGGGWGTISAQWDSVSYAEALKAPPNSESSRRLVRDLVDTHLPAMKNTEDYVDLDDGLAAISSHAQELGYDAVILFLDELILWLASHAADHSFISREGNKVVKLVESSRSDRPIPLISFIARQRDLRELIGKHIAGAEKLSFVDVLSHNEGRFSLINLEDRNLPAIASKRILLPKSEEAKARMDAEFERTQTFREEVMKTLLTRNANREDFRKLYPFSPALVETLVAVSSLLQRERTALKVMAMLLAEQKETLKLGEIVPVGDLFDQVSQGDEAFTSDMKVHFDNAHRLYQQYLKPLLEREHDVSFEIAKQAPWDDPKRRALRNDDRLVKTLLLAALVPEVEALKNMTPQRLAALNHGTIASPIPGQEATTVIAKFKRWAASAGQIKIREGAGQMTLAIQLSSIDTEQILAQAEGVDNRGNRIAKLKELIFHALGRDDEKELYYSHDFKWRGTPRRAEIIFQNIRDLPADSLICHEDGWKVVIDYPFDDPKHTIRDDIARIDKFLSEEESTRTICWLPSFFNHETLEALGTFVRLEQILKETQFPNYVRHLTETDRETARNQLESQREQLRSQIVARVEMAYGIRGEGKEYIDESNSLEPSEQFRCLERGVHVRPPVAANLKAALDELLDQALRQQFPAHPHLEDRVSLTKAAVGKVLDVIQQAAQSSEPSILVDPGLRRPVAQLVNPLKLGEMGEQRLTLGHHWQNHFNKLAAQESDEFSVGKLRNWIDHPKPMGLPEILQDLIILTFAAQTDRVLLRHGGPVSAELGALENDITLEAVSLPSESHWEIAVERAKAIFGVPVSPLMNAANVSQLSDALHAKTKDWLRATQELVRELESALDSRFPNQQSGRLESAREALRLIRSVESVSGKELVETLAKADLKSGPNTISTLYSSASETVQGLQAMEWKLFDAIAALDDDRAPAARQLRADLESAFLNDEFVTPLAKTLKTLRGRAVDLLAPPSPSPKPPHPVVNPEPDSIVPPPKKTRGRCQVQGDDLPAWIDSATARQLMRSVAVSEATSGEKVSINVSPLYGALIELDSGAQVDLMKQTLWLPKFNKRLAISIQQKDS